jgi:hypothetical protein
MAEIQDDLDLQLRLLELEREKALAQQKTTIPSAEQKKREPEIGALEAFGRGAAGMLSPISKYGEAAGIKARTAYEDIKRGKPSFGVPYGLALETAEELETQSAEEQPLAYYGGKALGLAGGVGYGMRATAPSLLKAIGIGAGEGAAYTAGSIPKQFLEEQPGEAALQTAIGAAAGAAIPAALGGVALRKELGAGYRAAVEANREKGIIGLPMSAVEGIKATRGAIQEPKAMREVIEQIAAQPKQTKAPSMSIPPESFQPEMTKAIPKQTVVQQIIKGPSISPEEEAQFLVNLLQQGKTPAKEFLTQKSTQLYPGQIGAKRLGEALEMPLSQRVQAREFNASEMGRELQPAAEKAKAAMLKKGPLFKQLQDEARLEYKSEGLEDVYSTIRRAVVRGSESEAYSSGAKSTLKGALEILNTAKGPYTEGLKRGGIKSVDPADQFDRLFAARRYIDDKLKVMKAGEPEAVELLNPVRDALNSAMKTSPSQRTADALYSSGTEAYQTAIKPLEMSLGEGKKAKRELSGTNIKLAFGDTLKGEKMQRGIEMSRKFADDFAEQLGPENRQAVVEFFDALANAKTVADRKRLLDSIKFAEGPSGAAIRAGIERLQQTIKPAPGGAEMFRAAPEYLTSVDTFMADQAAKRFGKSYDELTGAEQLKLVNMFQWFKENPNATMKEIENKFTSILRGAKK